MQENKSQKIIAIGDIHGRDIWEQIIEKEKSADKIIFIGDYFDTLLPISSDLQIINFEKIISFKKENKDKVV